MNDLFAGMVVLDETLTGMLLTRNASGVPTDATGLPTFRVYGPDGYMEVSGSCTLLDSSNTNGTYSYEIDATAVNGFESGKNYNVLFSFTVSAVVYGAMHSLQVA